MESFDNDRQSDSADECEVGYRKPPRHSRFKKGQSGNTRGKTRGTKSIATLFRQALLAALPVKQNERQTKTTKLLFILTQLINRCDSAVHYTGSRGIPKGTEFDEMSMAGWQSCARSAMT